MIYKNPSLRKLESQYVLQVQTYRGLKQEWNMLIRNFYKKNMGVGLSEGFNQNQIEIKIVAAPKEGFIDIIEKKYRTVDFEMQYYLHRFIESGENVHPYLDEPTREKLAEPLRFAKTKVKQFDLCDTTNNIFRFLQPNNKDVFGSYFLNDYHIEIYVFPIKLFCMLHGLDDKAFFVNVLAHELAHGYNHIGLDKDNYFWKSFSNTDDNLAEGLAQFYSSKFIDAYLVKEPKLRAVFNALLKWQPEPYHMHEKWNLSLEQMYGAFIDARRNNVTKHEFFESIMDGAKQRLKQK
jgi:hypothetical protein